MFFDIFKYIYICVCLFKYVKICILSVIVAFNFSLFVAKKQHRFFVKNENIL